MFISSVDRYFVMIYHVMSFDLIDYDIAHNHPCRGDNPWVEGAESAKAQKNTKRKTIETR